LEVASTQKIATQPETAGACAGSRNEATLDAADWLSLAGTPTFAIMALLTAVLGGGPMDIGMVMMYLLMSAFHSAYWLKLVYGRRSGSRQS
jgi:hypothetical protein